MAFPSEEEYITRSHLLREMNFGKHEGLHYDNLPQDEKDRFSDPKFKAEGGEGWVDVRKRAETYFSNFKTEESHLVFTHGGLMTSSLYDLEQFEMPPNGSFIGVHLQNDNTG